MDTEEENILAIYINLIYETIATKKKKIYEIFCFCRQMANTEAVVYGCSSK